MTGELARIQREVPEEILDASTGELVHRTDLPRVAGLLSRIREYERDYRDAKAWANDALLEAMDARAQWTLHFDGVKASAPSPTAGDVVWDVEVLQELQDHLPPERYAELVRTVVSYEPVTGKLRMAAKAGGVVGEIIKRAETVKPSRRYVKISRAK